jgi:hypothetical protein
MGDDEAITIAESRFESRGLPQALSLRPGA